MLPMSPRPSLFRLARIHLKSVLVVIACLALLFTVILQTARLEKSASREAVLRSELRRERALARQAVDDLFTRIVEQSSADNAQKAGTRRDALERALKFYEATESSAATPELKTRAREVLDRIRSELDESLQ
jgi:hypothetical protein